MPLWQKVQREPREVPDVSASATEAVPDMSAVDVLDVEASKAPLWSSTHMKDKPSMWQQVNSSRTAAGNGADAVAAESEAESAGPSVSDVAKGAAPLWSQVHTKKPANMWQQVNVARDQSLVDVVPGAPEPEVVAEAPKSVDVAASQPPAWQKVHLNVKGEPEPEAPPKKKGFFSRIFGFLGFGK